MMLLFVLIMLLSSIILQNLRPSRITLERNKKTQEALAEAKGMLLGRAILDENRPGSLPCPDADNNGSADLFAGNRCPSYIGRFPWRTLGIPALQDANGEALWYTLSANYRDHSAVMPLNSNVPGSLSVDAQTDVVAIIFAVGAPLATQKGRPSTNLTDYLEGENANTDNVFSAFNSAGQNDRLLFITRGELMHQVERRVLAETASAFQYYYANPAHAYFPFAALALEQCAADSLLAGFVPTPNPTNCPASSLPIMTGWFSDNAWGSLLHYEVAIACVKATPNCSGSGFISDADIESVRARFTIISSGQKRLVY